MSYWSVKIRLKAFGSWKDFNKNFSHSNQQNILGPQLNSSDYGHIFNDDIPTHAPVINSWLLTA